jgi:hypothetical protein
MSTAVKPPVRVLVGEESAEVSRVRRGEGDWVLAGEEEEEERRRAVWAEEKKEWLLRSCLPGAKTGRRVGLLNF